MPKDAPQLLLVWLFTEAQHLPQLFRGIHVGTLTLYTIPNSYSTPVLSIFPLDWFTCPSCSTPTRNIFMVNFNAAGQKSAVLCVYINSIDSNG